MKQALSTVEQTRILTASLWIFIKSQLEI